MHSNTSLSNFPESNALLSDDLHDGNLHGDTYKTIPYVVMSSNIQLSVCMLLAPLIQVLPGDPLYFLKHCIPLHISFLLSYTK